MSMSFSPIEGIEKHCKEKNRKHKELEEGGSEIEASSSWLELPLDLLEEVMSRISLSDQVRFRAVCKSMLAIDIPLAKYLPWIICIDNGYNEKVYELIESSSFTCLCRIHEPSYKPKETSYKIDLHQFHIFPHCSLCIKTVSKNGWIFYSVQHSTRKRASFLLFAPLTKQVIKLPSIFHWRNHDSEFIKTFSTDPDSPDCVFLVLHHNANVNRITIRTWQRGDKYWSRREFDKPDNFDGCGRIPLYICGKFYFVFPMGKLASYNVASGEWKVQTILFDALGPEYHVNYSIYQAFELNGELMLLGIIQSPSMEDKYGEELEEQEEGEGEDEEEYFGFITKFDRSYNVWVPLESLGDHALFVDKNSCSAKIVNREARNNGVLPNKIYHLSGSLCNVYSLEGGNLTCDFTFWNKVNWIHGIFWFEPPDHIVKKKPRDQTGDQFVEDDDQLHNLKLLYQMRRSRNDPRNR